MSDNKGMNHQSKASLFALAKNGCNDTSEEYKKVGAWFLGPKGENEELLQSLISESIHEHAVYRSTHYKKDDPACIDDTIKNSPEYDAACNDLHSVRRELSTLLHGSVPFFSRRYQAHMLSDTVLPANVGYFTAMLYNQNNVATEASPATCALEKEVAEQLCGLMGFSKTTSWGHITADGTIANLESMWMARNLKFYPLAIKEALQAYPELVKAKNELKVTVYESERGNCDEFVMVPKRKYLADCSIWQLFNLCPDEIMELSGEIVKLCNLGDNELDNYIAPYLLQNKGLMYYSRKYPALSKVRVFVPATKHYSWPKSGTILGLGQDNIVGIPVDDNCRMDITELEKALFDCASHNIPVLMVVAVIGSTEEGVVDNLEGILALREKVGTQDYRFKGLQFLLHCDAAWGGYLRTMMIPAASENGAKKNNAATSGFIPYIPLSAYAQKQYSLLSKADTVTIDPHKAGFIPYSAGSLCYRNGLMRYLITFNADYIHSAANLNMGIFGVEGSKPGAAPAAVWMAHKSIPLDTGGYGQILGECMFSTKLYYCYWLALAAASDDFRIEPLIPLPEKLYNAAATSVIASGKGEIIDYIRENIIGKDNAALAKNPDVIGVFQQIGADVLINSFVVNFKSGGKWNQDLDRLNTLNSNIAAMFSITTPEQASKDTVEFILTSSKLTAKNYKVPLARIYKNLNVHPTGDGSMIFLINTILQPWATSHEFIGTIMSIFKAGVEKCIKNSIL